MGYHTSSPTSGSVHHCQHSEPCHGHPTIINKIRIVGITHDWLVAKWLYCKPQSVLKCLLVSFVPTLLHIWHFYVWFWRLLALWVAPGAVQQCSKQVLAVTKVWTLTIPLHLKKHRGSQWVLMPQCKCLLTLIIHLSA